MTFKLDFLKITHDQTEDAAVTTLVQTTHAQFRRDGGFVCKRRRRKSVTIWETGGPSPLRPETAPRILLRLVDHANQFAIGPQLYMYIKQSMDY